MTEIPQAVIDAVAKVHHKLNCSACRLWPQQECAPPNDHDRGATQKILAAAAPHLAAAERERCAQLAEQHGIRYSKPVPCNCGGDRCPGETDEWFDFADLLRGDDG